MIYDAFNLGIILIANNSRTINLIRLVMLVIEEQEDIRTSSIEKGYSEFTDRL